MLPIRKYVIPELIFGKGSLELLPQYAVNFNSQKIFIVTDQGVIDAGWLDRVTSQFDTFGMEYVIFSNLQSNPRDIDVMEGAQRYAESNCDVIVALGGGSPIDCAKGIGIVSTNKKHILDFEGVDNVDVPGPPLICIPTTAGSAADVSQFAIINNSSEKVKMAIISKSMVPDVALIDPATTTTMDSYLTICTGMDVLVHAIEAYVSLASSPLTDVHALKAIHLIKKYLPQVLHNLEDLKNRERIMLASLQAGLAFSNASLGAVHALAHSLGGFYDYSHGECNGLLLEYVVAYNYEYSPKRYDKIGDIFGVNNSNASTKERKSNLINSLRIFREEIGLGGTLGDRGVCKKDIIKLAHKAILDPCMLTNPRRPELHEIEVLYEEAL